MLPFLENNIGKNNLGPHFLFFPLASDRLFRQGQKATTFSTNHQSQEQFLGNVLKFFSSGGGPRSCLRVAMWQNSLTTQGCGAYHRWGAESGGVMGEVGRAGRGEGGGTGIGMCKIIIIIKILLWDILCQTPDGSGHYQHHHLPHSYWCGPSSST